MYTKLRYVRQKNSISAKFAGELLGVCPESYLGKEGGKINFTVKEAKVMADFYGYSIDDLFFDDKSEYRINNLLKSKNLEKFCKSKDMSAKQCSKSPLGYCIYKN